MESATPTPQNRPLKISILHLMLVTVLAALLSAFLAKVIRSLPEDDQPLGIALVLVIIISMLSYLWWSFVSRSRLEKRAGARHYFSRGPMVSVHHMTGLFSCMFCLYSIWYGIAILGRETHSPSRWFYLTQVCIFGSWALNYLLGVFVWKVDFRSIDVRENGLILGEKHFVPWSYVNGFRWNKFSKKLMLLNDGGFTEWAVPEKRKAELAKVIERFVPHQAKND